MPKGFNLIRFDSRVVRYGYIQYRGGLYRVEPFEEYQGQFNNQDIVFECQYSWKVCKELGCEVPIPKPELKMVADPQYIKLCGGLARAKDNLNNYNKWQERIKRTGRSAKTFWFADRMNRPPTYEQFVIWKLRVNGVPDDLKEKAARSRSRTYMENKQCGAI